MNHWQIIGLVRVFIVLVVCLSCFSVIMCADDTQTIAERRNYRGDVPHLDMHIVNHRPAKLRDLRTERIQENMARAPRVRPVHGEKRRVDITKVVRGRTYMPGAAHRRHHATKQVGGPSHARGRVTYMSYDTMARHAVERQRAYMSYDAMARHAAERHRPSGLPLVPSSRMPHQVPAAPVAAPKVDRTMRRRGLIRRRPTPFDV